jgi:glycosyltransferase involved in cell wall biosynthesis
MKRILLVADEPGWVFQRHCIEIMRRLPEYIIDIAYHNQNIPELSKKYDLVYVLDPMPMSYPPSNKTIMGLRCEFLFLEHPEGAKGLYEKGFPGRCVSIKDKCSILHMVNKNQMKVFKDVVLDKPLVLAQHGVDENIFDRNKYTKEKNEVLTISVSGRGSNNKGFDIIQAACNKVGVKILAAQYGRHKLTKEQMPLFYNKVDAHICFSKNEGLNNPIMEAGAMGVPVISTRSGAAEEIIKDGNNGFLIDRNMDSLIIALNKIKDDKLREIMGNNMYNEVMTNWIWKVRIEDFRIMFRRFLNE